MSLIRRVVAATTLPLSDFAAGACITVGVVILAGVGWAFLAAGAMLAVAGLTGDDGK